MKYEDRAGCLFYGNVTGQYVIVKHWFSCLKCKCPLMEMFNVKLFKISSTCKCNQLQTRNNVHLLAYISKLV